MLLRRLYLGSRLLTSACERGPFAFRAPETDGQQRRNSSAYLHQTTDRIRISALRQALLSFARREGSRSFTQRRYVHTGMRCTAAAIALGHHTNTSLRTSRKLLSKRLIYKTSIICHHTARSAASLPKTGWCLSCAVPTTPFLAPSHLPTLLLSVRCPVRRSFRQDCRHSFGWKPRAPAALRPRIHASACRGFGSPRQIRHTTASPGRLASNFSGPPKKGSSVGFPTPTTGAGLRAATSRFKVPDRPGRKETNYNGQHERTRNPSRAGSRSRNVR